MKIDLDQLIRVVAERYRFIITKDDPVLASVSLNEVVFELHTNMLIQKMDEQNARIVAALQGALNSAKAEGIREREKFTETVQAIHRQNIDEYRTIIAEHLSTSKSYTEEITRSKNSAWLAMIAAFGFAFVSICANLFIVVSK
jgi:hypothetical protein